MLKWFTDWLTGKTPEVNEIQTNPFPATDKAPVNPQITDAVTQVVASPKAAKTKAGKKPAAKKPAAEKPAKATKAKAEKKPAPKAKAKKKQPA
jgi:hypothetical protein